MASLSKLYARAILEAALAPGVYAALSSSPWTSDAAISEEGFSELRNRGYHRLWIPMTMWDIYEGVRGVTAKNNKPLVWSQRRCGRRWAVRSFYLMSDPTTGYMLYGANVNGPFMGSYVSETIQVNMA